MNHLIIGGAGFIGSNLASKLLSKNETVTIFDNLSRSGSQKNLDWLKTTFPQLKFINGDIVKDQQQLNEAVSEANRVYHLAAQVAVTTSVVNPREDFEINALGTLNVLEALRLFGKKDTSLIYSSTNKVYGGLDDLPIIESKNRYDFENKTGVNENRSLDFHSPYGCSKGCADQYVRDYSRIYDLNTVVFRQSCIYGPRQFGVEDQGWVAWFIIALLTNKPITIYGDGKQVRDLLYVDDLTSAYCLALDNISKTKGQVFNLGGGQPFSISIWFEFKEILEKLFGKKIDAPFAPWRPGDQKIFVSDISKAKKTFGWEPKVNPQEGITLLFNWVSQNLNLFS
jgi:CDP-paratose 2-epimerase